MEAKELRAKSSTEIRAELKDLLKAQFSLRMQLATQQSNKTDQVSKLRRDIARCRTIMSEKARQA